MTITGFGPFMEVAENPSGWLAERLSDSARVLSVTFREVDAFLDEMVATPPDSLLMIGVARGTSRPRLERLGRNWVGGGADASGEVRGPNPIREDSPQHLVSPIVARLAPWPEWLDLSEDAGDYLCNYALYEALRRLPGVPVGFLHIPDPDDEGRQELLQAIAPLVQTLSEA